MYPISSLGVLGSLRSSGHASSIMKLLDPEKFDTELT